MLEFVVESKFSDVRRSVDDEFTHLGRSKDGADETKHKENIIKEVNEAERTIERKINKSEKI